MSRRNRHLSNDPPPGAPIPASDEEAARRALLFMLEDLEEDRRKIEQARREWTRAFDAIRDPVFIHDADYRIVRANRSYADAAGMDVRAVIGKRYWEVFPKRAGPFPGCMRRTEKAEAEEEEEEEMTLETGTVYVSRAFVLRDADRKFVYAVHVLEDVTEKRRAEKEIRLLSEALRQSAAGMLLLNTDLSIRYVNPAARTLIGYEPGELDGLSINDVVSENMREQTPAIKATVDAIGYWSGEGILRSKDGTQVPAYLAASRIVDADGNMMAYVGSWLDLRPIKQTEEALRDEKRFSDETIESVPGIFYMFDTDGRFVRWNRSMETITGYSREDILRMHPLEFFRAEDKPLVAERIAEAFAKGEATVEPMVATKDGRHIPFLFNGRRVELMGKTYLVGTAVDISARVQAEAALHRSYRALRVLSASNANLIHAESEPGLLGTTCRAIVEIGGYLFAWVGFVVDSREGGIRPVAQAGLGQDLLKTLKISWSDIALGCGLISQAVWSATPQVARDIPGSPAFAPLRAEAAKRGYAAMLVLPLKEEDGEVFGALAIYAAEANAFDEDEVRLFAEMADDLAFGIQTLRMRIEHNRLQEEQLKSTERLKETLTDTIRAVARTVEKRDPYTAGHQQRVAELCRAIGREMQLPEDRIEGLRLGALIHDIGKIYVPAEILNRPGKLAAAEFEIIKAHPEVGYDIVKDVKFPWPVAEIIRQHHEHLDGSGYPQGLKDADILLESRILTVADTVEAMASHRPYRPARGIDAGLEEISNHRGDWYDPAAVDACLKLFREKRFTFAS